MGYTLRSFFVPVREGKNDLSEIRKHYEDEYGENIQYHPGTGFAAVGPETDSDFEPWDLSEDSEVFGEAIGIQVMTYGDDFFFYDHWINGEQVRGLTYDPYAGWIRVEGKQEEWEKKSFFEPGMPEEDLSWMEQDTHMGEKEKAQRIFQLRHLTEVLHLVQDFYYPVISGEKMLFDLITFFNLTCPRL